MRRWVEAFSWFGLFAGALAWTVQLVVGYGTTIATCSEAGRVWSVDKDAWEIGLMAAGCSVALLAEASAVRVFLDTRSLDHEEAPPWGRRNFFATAAVAGNVLFFIAILLSGLGSIYLQGCRGA